MAVPVLIYGKSGSGKSRSLKFFNEDEIFLVNVEGKALPFKKKFKYELKTDSVDVMINQFLKMPCKAAVIDDCGYLMTHYFMTNHRNKSGSQSFEMYDSIADTMYFLVDRIKKEIPDDKIIYLVFHEDVDDYGNTKLRTIGRLIDNKVVLEGMVTISIRCMSEYGRHFFLTQTEGNDITKSPEDMFSAKEIDNNLKLVDTAIREYYGIDASIEKEKLKEGKNDVKTERI